jgi:DNA-binding beta-propeller fold protein YncE
VAASFAGGGESVVVADYAANKLALVQLGVAGAEPAIHLSGEPNAAAVTPDGTTVSVAIGTKNEIVPIATATGVVGKAIVVGADPDALAIDAAGSEAVVANHGQGTISLVNLSTSKMTTLTVGSDPDAVVITGNMAFVADFGSNGITPVNLDTSETEPLIMVPDGPDALSVSPTGHSVLVGSRTSNMVSKVRVSSRSLEGVTLGVSSPTGIVYSSSFSTAYVVTYSGLSSSWRRTSSR